MLYLNKPPAEKKRKAPGKVRELVLYRRMMDRLWGPFLLLGLLLLVVYFSGERLFPPLTTFNAQILLVGAILITAFGLFAWAARYRAYFRAYPNHLRVVTPFLNLRISYRRVQSIRASPVSSIFPPSKIGWSSRNFLEPYFAETALVIQLNDYPISRSLLRLFLPKEMLLPNGKGLVLIARNWMEVSSELDSFIDAFRHSSWDIH